LMSYSAVFFCGEQQHCNTSGVYHHNYKVNLMVNMIVSTKSA